MVNHRKEANDSCTSQPNTTLALLAGSLWTHKDAYQVWGESFDICEQLYCKKKLTA